MSLNQGYIKPFQLFFLKSRGLLICIGIVHFINISCYSQKESDKIELSTFLRWDFYPKFKYSINTVNYNTLKINGTSPGFNLVYKRPASKKIFLRAGIGYYKYRFNKMRNTNSLFANQYSSRDIEDYRPPGPITPSITFATDKYWYNCLNFLFGVEKRIRLKNNYSIGFSGNLNNYFTTSQVYHITYPFPEGDKHKRNNIRYFGFSTELSSSIMKSFRRSQIGLSIIVPVFSYWKQDNIFPQERNNSGRNKLFNGFGVGFVCSFPLTQKQIK